MTNEMDLTASQIRYLLAIRTLHRDSGVPSAELAKALGLSKASVHNMMDLFLERQYIRKKPQGPVYFTKNGMETAEIYAAYSDKLKEELFSGRETDNTVDFAICAFLAELSNETLAVLAMALGILTAV